MTTFRKPIDPVKRARLLSELHRDLERRQKGYRMRALQLFPHVCAHCGREFSGKRLSELTVHHKDDNHDNNPPDGSNWELLCIYCHDDEHGVGSMRASGSDTMPVGGKSASPISNPFEGLDDLLDKKEKGRPEGG